MIFFSSLWHREPDADIAYPAVKRSLLRSRTATIPRNIYDVDAILAAYDVPENMQNYGMTSSGNRYFKYAHKAATFSYCIFASDDIIRQIDERIPSVNDRHYLMDATFKIVPLGVFTQLWIIYVNYLERVCFFKFFMVICVLIVTDLFRLFPASCSVHIRFDVEEDTSLLFAHS